MRTLAALVLLAIGCSDPAGELRVDVRTDYVAGIEFAEAVVRFDGVETRRAFGSEDHTRQEHRLAEVDARPGSFPLEVRLVAGDGRTLAARDVSVRVQGTSTGVTVVITRSCRDVVCGETESCLGGRCVTPECVRGDEPSCPEPECRASGDCTSAFADCVRPTCEAGVCLYAGSCAEGSFCDPVEGCQPLPGADAGPGDAGTDAGTDGGRCGVSGTLCDIDCTDDAAWPWADEEQELLEALNAGRAAGGECMGMAYADLPPFVMNPVLREVTRCQALHMGREERTTAMGPDGRSMSMVAEERGVAVLGAHVGGTGGTSARIAEQLLTGPSCPDPTSDAPTVGIGRVVQDGDPYWALLWEEP